MPRVLWLFSLIRSGSSAVTYAAAHGLRAAVADEPMGPMARTFPPYNYPPEQDQLQDTFGRHEHRFTPEVTRLAQRTFELIAEQQGSDTLIVKLPHDVPKPEQVLETFPDHRVAFLLRHPLHRLNSLYRRGWLDPSPIQENFDLGQYKAFAQRWLDAPNGVLYDDLRRDPQSFFHKLFTAWGLDFDAAHVREAVGYAGSRYHEASRLVAEGADPARPVSETSWAVPVEAIEVYLSDPFMASLFERCGWSLDPGDYTPGSPVRG